VERDTCCRVIAAVIANEEESTMDENRVKGAVKDKVGQAKEAAGKVFGDEKLKREGQADQMKGKVENAVGGVKDALRDQDKDRR
jgi:uncharacterized protein YjbJ (UPF0337 family)